MLKYLLVAFALSSMLQPSDGQCTEAKDFSCGFEGQCPCWRQGKNGVEDDIDWLTGTQVATSGWNSIPRSRTEHNSTFAYAVRDGQRLLALMPRGAMLVSKAIPCTDQPLTLRLWHWKGDFLSQIRICYKYFNESALVQCSAEVNGFQQPDWLPLNATLPAIKREFQIVIQATRLVGLQAVVAIDDITIDGDLKCSKQEQINAKGKNSGQKVDLIAKESSTNEVVTKTAQMKEKHCSDMKLEDSWSGDFNKGVWQICENGTNCKQLKGATAWDVQGAGRYVLESQKFKPESESVLRFEYKFLEKSFTSKLRLCIDSLDTCPFVKRGDGEGGKWSEGEIPLTAGWHKIFFTATNLKKNDHVRVRRISVRPKQDNSHPSDCSLMMTLIDE